MLGYNTLCFYDIIAKATLTVWFMAIIGTVILFKVLWDDYGRFLLDKLCLFDMNISADYGNGHTKTYNTTYTNQYKEKPNMAWVRTYYKDSNNNIKVSLVMESGVTAGKSPGEGYKWMLIKEKNVYGWTNSPPPAEVTMLCSPGFDKICDEICKGN